MLTRSALLLCGVWLVAAPAARADQRGVVLPGARGVPQTTSALQAQALGRIPQRKQPDEQADHRHPAPSPSARRTADGAATLSRSAKTAATLGSTFAGPTLDDSGAFPPDTMGDVGPSQFIVMINGRVRSYDKATGLADGVLNADTDVFFASVMTPLGGSVTSNFTSDPHIRYDRLSQRWIADMIDVPNDGNASNRIMLAVSDGPVITPATVWHFFFFNEGTSGEFADYPTLGIDGNALYIGTNQFGASPTGTFAGCNVYVVQKSSILGAGPVHVTAFSHVTTASGSGPYTPQGVDNADPAATTGWFAGVDNQVFGALDLIRVDSPGSTSPTLTKLTPLTVPATAFPASVPSQGGLALDAIDDRLFAAQIRDGHLWTAHNIGVTSAGAADTSNPSRDGSRWYDIDLTGGTPSLAQSGTVFDTASSHPDSFWIPSLAVDGEGFMVIGGSVSGSASHPDAWFASRAPGDPAGTVTTPQRYTAATATYNPSINGQSVDRWGDYSLTRVDPEDDQTLWTIQEYVSSTDTWGVRVAKVLAPAPAAPTGPVNAPANVSDGLVTLTTSSASPGWFDPGSAFPDRFAVSAGCGIQVKGVEVTSPHSAEVRVDTTGASGSGCGVTVTNPDGQAATAPGLLSFLQAPVATDDSGYSVPAGGTLVGAPSVLANDTDPRSEPLTAHLASGPLHGSVTLAPDGTFSYTADHGFTGADTFTYRALDNEVSSSTATVTVVTPPGHSPDQPPAAQNDSYAVTAPNTLNGGSVLTNDTDPDGDPLTAQLVSGTAHGTLTLHGDGTFTYAPAAGFSGSDSFAYRASDGTLTSASATAAIAVSPPTQTTTPTTPTTTTTTTQTTPVVPPIRKPTRCVVPQLRGKTLTQARRLLRHAHCRPGRVSRVRLRKSSIRHGRVLRTRPSAKSKLRRNAVVRLTLRR